MTYDEAQEMDDKLNQAIEAMTKQIRKARVARVTRRYAGVIVIPDRSDDDDDEEEEED